MKRSEIVLWWLEADWAKTGELDQKRKEAEREPHKGKEARRISLGPFFSSETLLHSQTASSAQSHPPRTGWMQSERRSCRSKPDCQVESTQSQECVCPNVSGGWDAVASASQMQSGSGSVWIWIWKQSHLPSSLKPAGSRRNGRGCALWLQHLFRQMSLWLDFRVTLVSEVWERTALHKDSALLNGIYSEDIRDGPRMLWIPSPPWSSPRPFAAHLPTPSPTPPPPAVGVDASEPNLEFQDNWDLDLIWKTKRYHNSTCLWLLPFPKSNVMNTTLEKKKKYTVARRKTLILATLWYFKCRRQQGKGLGAKVILSVQFSRSVVSNSLRPHGLQHTRLPCPSPTPGVYPNSCPLSRWCHPTISSSIVPFSSCLQSFPASGSFQMSKFLALGDQSIGVSASPSVLPMNIQDWFPLGWTSWISLQSKGLSRVFSNTTVQEHHQSSCCCYC